jgi:hypothetical protein
MKMNIVILISYISKCIKDLKRFMNWATKNGYNKSLEYKIYPEA